MKQVRIKKLIKNDWINKTIRLKHGHNLKYLFKDFYKNNEEGC
jgi:hypothetical protein